MKYAFYGIVISVVATSAFASPGHNEKLAVGEPGDKGKVTQTIRVSMKETPDGKMIFTPSKVNVRKDQTVKFSIKNDGELDHEFVMDEQKANLEHKAVMAKFPEMEHDNPNSVSLAPGKSGEIVWKFTNGGTFEFACLKPGHYESGMRGDLNVTGK